jgi:hypothetical protein
MDSRQSNRWFHPDNDFVSGGAWYVVWNFNLSVGDSWQESRSFLHLLSDSFIFYNNAITGHIPTEIGLLNLTEFLAYGNQLSGPIPTPFWSNTYLVDLRLEENDLLGTVASDIGELTFLQSLRLAGNSFTGTLPPEITRLSNLGK